MKVLSFNKEPDTATIEILEGALRDAKEGGVRGIMVIYLEADDTITTSMSSGLKRHQAVFGLNRLIHRVMRQIDEEQ